LLTALDISTTVRDGWVTLEGEVEWQYQKLAADAAIRHLPGIKGLINEIVVKPRVPPTEIKAGIEAALKRRAGLDSSRVTVEVKGREVTLRGSVRALSHKWEVERIAWSAPGVSRVENLLTVEP
jgi:osmotically-inducible protein OsmY